jgi:glucose/mannose transport system substrate-binding protein
MASEDELRRRQYLKRAAAGTIGMAGLAGCTGGPSGGGGSGGGGGNGSGGGNASGGGGSGGGDGSLEVIHWWTAGGEKDAINALFEGFRQEYPDVEINNNPAPGGAGSAQDAVIRNRILNENPPGTFQIWPGQSLAPYLEADALRDIGDVWTQEMRDAYVDGPKNLSRPNDTFVAVPINIHRLNNLFYNTQVVEQAGVDPTNITDPASLTRALERVGQNTDALGMAQATQSPWTTLQLWEMIFMSQQGVDPYLDMLSGNVGAHEQGIKAALSRVNEYRKHWNDDAGSISWDQANSMVINGEAAFMHQGDWAAGQYEAQDNFAFEENWNYVPFPGSQGTYSIVVDSFVFPQNNPSPDAAWKFLSYCGTKDAQRRFNPVKGSIPPRTDVSNEPFGPFLRNQREEFANSEAQPPTIAHGTGVTPAVKSAVEGAFASFTSNWNVGQTYNGIQQAFEQN